MRVSAIITAYNSESFVENAILSVLKQSLPVDEIVVVDDGSSDNTAAVVANFLDKGVKYLYQENKGPGAARNLGIRETSGAFLAFLDADDTWLENKNEIQMNYLALHPQVSMVSGLRWRSDGSGSPYRIMGQVPKSSEQLKRDILIHNLVGNPSMVTVRREVIEDVGAFNADIRWGQDWELWIRIVSQYEVKILPEPVIVYLIHSKNLSKMKRRKALSSYWNISRRAIQTRSSFWMRPLLILRSWSRFVHELALDARDGGDSRWIQAVYSSIALILYPWDDGWGKLNVLLMSIVGNDAYQNFKRIFRALT